MKVRRRIIINYYIEDDGVSIEDSEYRGPIIKQLENECEHRIYSQIKKGYTSGELLETSIINNEEVEFTGWWAMDRENK